MAVQEGALGVPISVTIKNPDGTARNISDATVKDFIFRRPDGVKVTKTASFLNDGSDGKLYYLTAAANDLSPPGPWYLQASIVQPGYTGRSNVGIFFVNKNL